LACLSNEEMKAQHSPILYGVWRARETSLNVLEHRVTIRVERIVHLHPHGLPRLRRCGLIWQSPFGPLRFEVAYPIMKAKFDESEWVRFSIGTRF
jgi:hypothetical protein